jgi:hypothetical protein
VNPPPSGQGPGAGRILGLVALGLVALCGLLGSCLLVLTLVLPLLGE